MQPAFVSAAKIAATLTPALRATDGVITITGTGDHLRPEWPITITGMRSRDLLVQPLGRVGEQVAVLVDRAALGRHVAPEHSQRLLQPAPAVDNQELWLAQPAPDEIVEDGAPRLAGLATHVLDGQ